ncbi:MAG: hypothetical protein HFJ48_04910 [Clostridia bacterium]|nr:hypothetical protein [Clostridia bacterium]
MLRAVYRATDYPGYEYIAVNNGNEISATNSDSLDYKDYGSMYCGKDGKKIATGYWWLASPYSSTSQYYMAYIDNNGGRFQGAQYKGSWWLSPLVSLRSDFTIQIEK